MKPRPRLKQLPFRIVAAPDLLAAIEDLPPVLRARAEQLHLRAVDDDRTWLEVTWQAAQAEGVTLAQVLGTTRPRRIVAARHRTWWAIRKGTADLASYPTIAKAFGVHHTSVMYAVETCDARQLAAAEALLAVERYAAQEGQAAA